MGCAPSSIQQKISSSFLTSPQDDEGDKKVIPKDLQATKKISVKPMEPNGNSYIVRDDAEEKRRNALVRTSWTWLEKEKDIIAQDTFLKIFQKRPDMKDHFTKFREYNGDELRNNVHFRNHALVFIQVIENSLRVLENKDEELKPILDNLGGFHTKKGYFDISNYELFTTSILEVFEERLGDRFSDEVKQVWEDLFNYITNCMAQGYIRVAKEKGLVLEC